MFLGYVPLVPAAHVSDSNINASYQLKTIWNNKEKRELFDVGDMAWSVFPSFTGWGIILMEKLNNFSTIMDEILNETTAAIE